METKTFVLEYDHNHKVKAFDSVVYRVYEEASQRPISDLDQLFIYSMSKYNRRTHQ